MTDERDATPEEAARILAALHELTSAPAPQEDCPFSLTPPKARGVPRGTQGGLFDGGEE